MEPEEKSSLGLDADHAAGLAVLLGLLGGLFFLHAEQRSRFVKLYAAQSVAISAAFLILFCGMFLITLMLALICQQFFLGTKLWLAGELPVIFSWLITSAIPLLCSIFWVILLAHAFTGRVWHLPVLGRMCEKWLDKSDANPPAA